MTREEERELLELQAKLARLKIQAALAGCFSQHNLRSRR